jgi:hypothetical protein
MKLFENLQSSLLIVQVLSSSLPTNAFLLTLPTQHQSSSDWKNQRFVQISRTESTSNNVFVGVRAVTDHWNDENNAAISGKYGEKTPTRTTVGQLFKSMVMASMIAIGSTYVMDVASVSAVTTTDHMNGTL